jgi:hypothetical protein
MERNYVEVLLEEMRSKFDLVLEGHAALRAELQEYRRESNERHDLTEFLLKALARDVSEIRTDLAAHRADTEAHARYRVRE